MDRLIVYFPVYFFLQIQVRNIFLAAGSLPDGDAEAPRFELRRPDAAGDLDVAPGLDVSPDFDLALGFG